MLGLNYHRTQYMLSAKNIQYLPVDIGIEVAFTGCSNAGKSSVINTLTNQKKLAYTSKIPGRTQLINLFEVIKGKRLVDLPGYGYAHVPIKIRNQWLNSLTEYIQNRHSLKGLVVVMDVRHPLKDSDNQIITLAIQKNISVLILLTKVDKLSASQIKKQLNIVIHKISLSFIGDIQIELFSSLKKIGINNLTQRVDYWFMNHNSCKF